ncbi:MAG: hypothetical protein IMZ73_01460 [Chloroflexi bacterium]|nr:hypothetical protein [Chloroflexota bacterium]
MATGEKLSGAQGSGEIRTGRILEEAQVEEPCSGKKVVNDLGLDALVLIPIYVLG